MANPRSCPAAAAAVLHNAQVCLRSSSSQHYLHHACHRRGTVMFMPSITGHNCSILNSNRIPVNIHQLTFNFTGTNSKDSVSAKAAPQSTPPTLATTAQCRRHNLHCQAPARAFEMHPAPLITCQGRGHKATGHPRSSRLRRMRALVLRRRAPDRHRRGR
jgi:hypothetical protein